MPASKRDVAIVGGGIAGLSAAYDMARRGVDFALLEASNWLGGQIRTEQAAGFVVEFGAEGIALQETPVKRLIDSLSLTDRTVSQQPLRSFRVSGSDVTPLEPAEAAKLLDLRIEPSVAGKGLMTFKAGMAELVRALAGYLPDDSLVLGARVASITRGRGLYRIEYGSGRAQLARSVLLAVPADETARLLAPLHAPTARVFQNLQPFSSVSVSLAYQRKDVAHPLGCGGFIMAGRARKGSQVRACTVVSERFPEHAPQGWVLLRVFFRPRGDTPIDRPDSTWVEVALSELTSLLGLNGRPQHIWVSRWPSELNRQSDAQLEGIREVRSQLTTREPIELAGAASEGDGIERAILSGHRAVESLLSGLPSVAAGKRAT